MATKASDNLGRYQLELPLITEPYQEQRINKNLEICRRLYNQMVKKTRDMYFEVTKTKAYRAIDEELLELYRKGKETFDAENERRVASGKAKKAKRTLTPREKELYAQKNQIIRDLGLTDFGLQSEAIKLSKPWVSSIDSTVAANVGARLYRAWDTVLYQHKGEQVHFCKYGKYLSIEGKNNKTGPMIRTNYASKYGHWVGEKPLVLVWYRNELEIPVDIDLTKPYEVQALNDEICYSRIIKRVIKGKDRFFVQIVLKGNPPVKCDKETGEVKYPLGEGVCAIDIGTRYITVKNANAEYRLSFDADADEEAALDEREQELTTYLERSRRINNPDNYNEDGTIRRQGSKKVIWHNSHNYHKARKELAEIRRKRAYKRKHRHYALANKLVQEGSEFYIRQPQYKGLQKRKDPSIDEKGRRESTKNAGAIIKQNAPAAFINIFTNKVKQRGGTINVVKATDVSTEEFLNSIQI